MPWGLQRRTDLHRIHANAAAVKQRTGRFVYAVVKADGYGCDAQAVARAVADAVDGYYVFDLSESVKAELHKLGKPVIAVDHPWRGYTADDYVAAHVRPIVHSAERAEALLRCKPVLSVDTGMHRLAATALETSRVLERGWVREAMTHAVRHEQVRELVERCGGRGLMLHAAATALLDDPEAWLDAVRPGLALYRGAVRVSARVIEARTLPQGEPAGYGRFIPGKDGPARLGVILGGYAQGVKPGVCLIRGQRRRVWESGMQSSFVELRDDEDVGEEVVLLGDGLTEAEVASAWGCSEQEVLVRLGTSGR